MKIEETVFVKLDNHTGVIKDSVILCDTYPSKRFTCLNAFGAAITKKSKFSMDQYHRLTFQCRDEIVPYTVLHECEFFHCMEGKNQLNRIAKHMQFRAKEKKQHVVFHFLGAFYIYRDQKLYSTHIRAIISFPNTPEATIEVVEEVRPTTRDIRFYNETIKKLNSDWGSHLTQRVLVVIGDANSIKKKHRFTIPLKKGTTDVQDMVNQMVLLQATIPPLRLITPRFFEKLKKQEAIPNDILYWIERKKQESEPELHSEREDNNTDISTKLVMSLSTDNMDDSSFTDNCADESNPITLRRRVIASGKTRLEM